MSLVQVLTLVIYLFGQTPDQAKTVSVVLPRGTDCDASAKAFIQQTELKYPQIEDIDYVCFESIKTPKT
jgi:hypothetical protein